MRLPKVSSFPLDLFLFDLTLEGYDGRGLWDNFVEAKNIFVLVFRGLRK